MSQYKIDIVHNIMGQGVSTFTNSMNNATLSTSRFQKQLSKNQVSLLRLRKGMSHYNNILRVTGALTKKQAVSLKAIQASYLRLGGSMNMVQGHSSSLLTSFTKMRWMMVNVAMVAASLYAGFNMILKPAIELESELANVRKTTNFSKQEMEGFKESIIDLSKQVPMTAKELAKIGAVAGQLGLGTNGVEAVESFTRTVSLMATATEMSSEEAAKNLAKISQAFDIPISQAGNLGSAINELSNTTAATSTEIVSAMTRIGAVGANLGMSAEMAAALGSTLVGAGMGAERAGTRMRSALTSITSNMRMVAESIPGQDIESFSKLLEDDTDEAIMTVVKHLHDMDDAQRAAAEATRISGRVGGFSWMTLVNNYDELSKNIDTANRAWMENVSLLRETAVQTGTTANQWKLLTNEVRSLTLGTDGLVNSLVKLVRVNLEARRMRKDEGVFGNVKQQLMDIMNLSPLAPGIGLIAGAQIDEKKVTSGLDDIKKKLKEVYSEEGYAAIEKVIDSQETSLEKTDLANLALSTQTDKYRLLGGEIQSTLNHIQRSGEIGDEAGQLSAESFAEFQAKIIEIRKDMEDNGRATKEQIQNLEAMSEELEKVGEKTKQATSFAGLFVDEISRLMGLTPFDVFGGKESENQLKGFINSFSDFFRTGLDEFDIMNNKVDMLEESFGGMGHTFESQVGVSSDLVREWIGWQRKLNEEVDDGSEAIKGYEDTISDLENSVEDAKDRLSFLKDEIRRVNDEISNIQNRRFTISGIAETDIMHTISQQELAISKARFAAMGLGSAEEFLRNATVLTNDELGEQVSKVEELNEATLTAEDRYDAWKTTLQETIKSLVGSSQDLEKDVTGAVKKAQTELLGITAMETSSGGMGGVGGRYGAMESNLDALRLAQEIFFGEEREKLEHSERLWEDEQQGVNRSAQEAINGLRTRRQELTNLLSEQSMWEERQEGFREQIEENKEKIDDEKKSFKERKEAMKTDPEWFELQEEIRSALESNIPMINAEKKAWNELNAAKSGYTMQTKHGGMSIAPSMQPSRSSRTNHLLGASIAPGMMFGDFISRPGEPIQHFSPQDTVVGVKDTNDLNKGGNTYNVSINVNGVNRSPNELARQIKRELEVLS